MSCATPKSKILSKIDLEAIQDEHEGLFIKGLNFNQQRAIVKSIANELYRNTLSGNKETRETIRESILKNLDIQLNDYNGSITTFELLDDQDSIISIQEQKDRVQAVKNNLDKLLTHAGDLLSTLNSVKVKESTDKENSDEIPGDNDEQEAQLERNNHSTSFYLELNTRDTVSSRLKKFLAFIERKEFVNGKPESVKNVIGFTDFMEFEQVFNELHRLLAGTRTTKEAILKTLQDEANEAQQSSNKTLAWLQDFVTYYNEAPTDIQREFVSEMAKHRIEMMFVDYNVVFKTEDGKKIKEYQLRLNNDDSGATGLKILRTWKKNHTTSNIVEDGKYSAVTKKYIKAELTNLRKQENKDIRPIIFNNIVESMGIHLNPRFLDNFFYGGGKIRISNKKEGYSWSEYLASGGLFEKLVTSLSETIPIENIDFMDDNVIKGLAFSNAKFEDKEFSNSYRVADKTIYTYSMNQYLVNRVRDLLDDSSTLKQDLSDTIFAEGSLYLSRLQDTKSDFKKWFDINYLSLNPLKVRKGKRSDSVTEMSPLDYEVTKWGHYNSFGKWDDVIINDKKYKTKNNTYFFPTNSDKTRVMTMKGIAIEATEKEQYTTKAIDLFYEHVVLPEIKRIYNTSGEDFKKAANLKTFNGGIFYLLPSLNNVVFEDGQSLLDVARGTETLTPLQRIKVNEEIRKVLNSLTTEKLEKWNEVGILDKGNLKHLSNVMTSEHTSNNKDILSSKEMAMNQVFNYMIANANMYQLVIGDPAQYNKGGETIEEEIDSTYGNLTKRLTAEIAPGIEMEGKDYFQIFANELVSESEQYEYYKSIIGNDAEAYKKMKEADAQELTTYTEHLNILLYLGRITDSEYKEAKSAFDKEEDPSKEVFDKVLQPLKPVYVWNDIINVGDLKFDKKTYIKSSSFPLIPTLTKGLQLNRLRLAMEALEKSEVKNPEGLGVRLAIASAVKVGIPLNALELTKDNKGNFVNKIDLEGKYIRLKREGFRIQQDVPYDADKDAITDGSQQKKLLFTNYDNPKLEAEYIATYKQLYQIGLDKFNNRILNEQGEVDNNKIAEVLVEELKGRGETSKPLYDGLKVLDNKFALPLWLSPYADTYMSLLNSIVKKMIVSHKIPGTSKVLGARVGMRPDVVEGVKGQELIDNNTTGIIFIDSYDATKGLQGQREEDGAIKGAQVLIPFKFRDSQGKLLHAKDFLIENKYIIPDVILPIGTSGSGKSTFIKSLPQENLVIIEPDAMRVEFTGDMNDKSKDKEIYEEAAKRAIQAIKKGKQVVFDTTNLTKDKRRPFIEAIKKSLPGASIQYKLMELNPELAKQRIKAQIARGENRANVPDSTIDRHAESYKEMLEDIKSENITNYDSKGSKIDHTRLPKELLEMFGFRIPTQLHASMSYIEIVGFLPETMGDLVIAPAEFTVQMGSDFDVDKLYMYMYSTDYNKETKTLTKATIIENYDILSTQVKPKDLKLLEDQYIAGLHNKLLDIHLQVMRDKNLQANIHSPLGFGLYDQLLPELRSYDKKAITTVLSDQYQEDKFFDGTAGKNGIGFFSSYSIFNALAQNKDLTLIAGKTKEGNIPVKVEFGTEYNVSDGNLSAIKSLKKINPKNKTDVMATDQNLSVDNANEQGMHVINLNSDTFSVKAILTCLGFEEDISALFIAQPIIKDYVRLMRNKNSILTEYNPSAEREIIEELKEKYSQGKYDVKEHSKLADFRGKDAANEMMSMIEKGNTYNEFGITQASILDKFVYLKKIESPIGPLKQLLNLDSKGFSKNMYINKRRLETLATAPDGLVLNADNLFGEYVDDSIIPTTTAGFDNIYGNYTLIKSFGEHFLESNSAMEFDPIVKEVEAIKGTDRQLTEEALVKLKNHYKNYLLTNLNVNNVTDIEAIRKELLLNKSKGSFYDRLTKFKETVYGKENRFLNNITVTFDKLLEVDYDNSGGDMFDETSMYKSFVDLFMDSNDRNGIIPSDLVEELIIYSLIRGGNKAQQFIKFIPISALSKLVKIPTHGSMEVFTDQWIRHNSKEAVLLEKKDVESVQGVKVIQIVKDAPRYIRVVINSDTGKESLYKYIPGTKNQYVQINTFGTTNTTEYTPYIKTMSVFKDNNVRNLLEKVNPVNPLDEYKEPIIEIEATGTPVNTEVATTDLDFSSLSNLLGSIVGLGSTKYEAESKLAEVLLAHIDSNTRLTTDTHVTVEEDSIPVTNHYNLGLNTININRDLKSGKALLVSILHETLHSLSTKFTYDWRMGNKIPEDISKALDRLNNFKNQIINELLKNTTEIPTGTVAENFEATNAYSIAKYIKRGQEDKLDNLLGRKDVHGSFKSLINSVRKYTNEVKNNLPVTNKRIGELIAKGENIPTTERYFYYSLMNIDEFIAVPGTISVAREKLIKLAGGKYIEGVKNLFEKILEFLGITKDESAKFLNDIFTVSGIKEETVKEENKVQQLSGVKGSIQMTPTKKLFNSLDKKLKKGSVVKYNDTKYLFWNDNNGKAQLITTEGEKFSGTPNLDKLTILGSYPSTIYNNTEYIVTDHGNVYSGATGKMVYTGLDNSSVTQKQRIIDQAKESTKLTGEEQEDLNLTMLNELEEEGKELQEKCKGFNTPKAEKGMKSSFTGGSEWNLISDLKGATHEEGGIDVFVTGKKYAKYGAVISNLNEEDLIVNENKSNFTEHLAMGGWEIVKDLKGKSHSQGGIDLEVLDGNVHFTNGTFKIYAKCGCLIKHKAEEGVVVKTRTRKNKI